MIPIVRTLKSGKEIVVGQASTMESAERLVLRLAKQFPMYDFYIDCARTAEEVKRDARFESKQA